MKISILTFFIILALFDSWGQQQEAKDDVIISSSLLKNIESIKKEMPPELLSRQDGITFFIIDIGQKCDSTFISISPSFQPPILSKQNNKIGFVKVDNDYLLFFGKMVDGIMSNTIEISTEWDSIIQLEVEPLIYDGYTYIYYFNKKTCELIPQGKHMY